MFLSLTKGTGKAIGEHHRRFRLVVFEGYKDDIVPGLTFGSHVTVGTTVHLEERAIAMHTISIWNYAAATVALTCGISFWFIAMKYGAFLTPHEITEIIYGYLITFGIVQCGNSVQMLYALNSARGSSKNLTPGQHKDSGTSAYRRDLLFESGNGFLFSPVTCVSSYPEQARVLYGRLPESHFPVFHLLSPVVPCSRWGLRQSNV
jgi:hypothetical protein